MIRLAAPTRHERARADRPPDAAQQGVHNGTSGHCIRYGGLPLIGGRLAFHGGRRRGRSGRLGGASGR